MYIYIHDDNYAPPTTLTANMTCSDSDVIIVLDSSGTIGDKWPVLKQFSIDLINALMVRDSVIRVGVIAYAYKVCIYVCAYIRVRVRV